MFKRNNRWLSLAILLSAPLLSVIDIFIINVAIPSIRKGLHATDGEVQLVIAGYLLGYASFLITGGRAGDIFGRKKVFLIGMFFFALVSCLCGLSLTAGQLDLSRFFQGISAAFMVPQTISYIQVLFPESSDRTKAVGMFGITIGLASIIGQFMGGYLSEMPVWFGGWRLIFFINLPIGLFALIMAARYLKETTVNKSQKFDYSGVAILTIALISLIFPLILGRENGWPLWSVLALPLSFAVFGYFVFHQKAKLKKGGNPLIHTGLFNHRDFNLGLLGVLFLFMAQSSYLLLSTVYFQEGLRMHSYNAGLAFIFFGIGFMVSSILSVRYVIRYGKNVLQWGLLIMITALALQFFFFGQGASWWLISMVLMVHGFGSGVVLPSLMNMALKSIPAHFAGAASGVYSTFQQTASALGICAIGGLFFYFSNGHTVGHSFFVAFRYSILAEVCCLSVVSLSLQLLPDVRKEPQSSLVVSME